MAAEFAAQPSRVTVSVDVVSTVLVSPAKVYGVPAVGVELVNDDGTQTLDAYVETSTDAAGPWSRQDTTELTAVGPGEGRSRVFDVRAHHYVRIVGLASGIGLSARVAAWRGW